MIDDEGFMPIAGMAKDDRVVLLKNGPEYARGWWTGDMWAYDFGDKRTRHQIDFEPTHFKELKQ